MNTTFMNSPRLLFTSESVTEGHPDKTVRPDQRRRAGRLPGAGPASRAWPARRPPRPGLSCCWAKSPPAAQVNFDELVRRVITRNRL